ncbi:MAG TPA: S8 family peptidase [Anaerolineae bacterium]|nr:S8 family peptidase [Anaerolineae bacterium]
MRNKNHLSIRASVNWGERSIPIVLALSLMLSLVLTASMPLVALRGQPILLQLAAERPDEMVRVIVQKVAQDASVEEAVVRLGGAVTLDLHIINAFAATLPAGAVPELSRSAGVRWVSLDAPLQSTACTSDCLTSVNNLRNAYIQSIRADKVWLQPAKRQGTGIGVAVVDSGVNSQMDLYTLSGRNRVVASVRFNTDYNPSTYDNYGHGSHVAGVVGGNGRTSNGAYIGVAPMADIINVKVSNDDGSATTSMVVAGLQWLYDNRNNYNLRVVNISLNSAVAESYHTSPLDAAVEVLWFNKIVVVVSAGNTGEAALYPPANDPFVITVGAVDDKGTASLNDDVIPTFSAYGTTSDGFAKPDLVAPGKNIVSLMGNSSGGIPAQHPNNWVDGSYYRMSGTSTSAPMVAGAAALLLEDEPNLTPDQVKYRLTATAKKAWAGYNSTKAGAGYLDAYAAVNGATTASANTGLQASQLLWTGSQPVNWGSVTWNSVNWSSVNWSSVNWSSVNWSSVNWSSDYWGD